jgi:hypothetical protein
MIVTYFLSIHIIKSIQSILKESPINAITCWSISTPFNSIHIHRSKTSILTSSLVTHWDIKYIGVRQHRSILSFSSYTCWRRRGGELLKAVIVNIYSIMCYIQYILKQLYTVKPVYLKHVDKWFLKTYLLK